MTAPAGTWEGHWLPGAALLIWGLWWLGRLIAARGARPSEGTLEWGRLAPSVKILLMIVSMAVEHPNRGWYPEDYVMALHHNTIYIAIALSGVVDLLARRGVLAPRVTHFALAGASFIGALIFAGHGNHPGVESTVHSLLVWAFVGVGVSAIAEVVWEDWRLDWLRTGAMIALGSWLIVISWVLFRSGWDLSDPVRIGWAYLLFAWNAIAAACLMLGARVIVHARGPGGGG